MQLSEIFGLIKVRFPEATQEEKTRAIVIPKIQLLDIARYLRNHELAFDILHCITAIERNEKIELIYAFYSMQRRLMATVKIYLPLDDLKVESLTALWKSADWFEREAYDLFGVIFLNHPDPRRILNPYDWTVHPLRKDFSHTDFVKKPRY